MTPIAVDYLVGVDLGGTKIMAGVYGPDLLMVGCAKRKTKAERGVDAVIERIARTVREAVEESGLTIEQVRGVGIGAPGAVDPAAGQVVFAVNLAWKDVALASALQTELGVPVFLENDCNLAMLGIWEREFQRTPRDAVGIFLGTGIGGGLILNGALYGGFRHAAGEIGHMTLDVNGHVCGCGNRGCFETLASRNALFRMLSDAVAAGEPTLLTQMLGANLNGLRSGDLRKAIRRGDALTERIVRGSAEFTGVAVANLISVLHPQLVVLGGGVIEALGFLMMPIISRRAKAHLLPGTLEGIEIVESTLADNAGITGGAVLARDQLGMKVLHQPHEVAGT